MPDPSPKPGQTVVRVAAGGMNFADLMTTKGGYPGTPPPPFIVGREFSGIEENSGRRVMGYAQWSAFAEKTCRLFNLLWPVPDRWSDEASCSFSGELLHGVPGILAGRDDRASAKQAESVACLIHAVAGGVGHCRGTDRAVARHRDVRHIVVGREAGASEGTRVAARHQLQAARLRRDGSQSDTRRRRGCGLRNARRRAYGEEPALPARLRTRHSIRNRDRTSSRSSICARCTRSRRASRGCG